MQPTYLPWIGYFGLMDSIDEFVILDSVQFDKRSWQQRNKIKTATGPIWLTIPTLTKGNHRQLIKDVEIDFERKYVKSHTRSIEQNYAKSLFFSSYAPDLFNTLGGGRRLLSSLTIDLIILLRDCLGIETPLKYASEIDCGGEKETLLVNL